MPSLLRGYQHLSIQKRVVTFSLLLILIAFDQITKWWVLEILMPGPRAIEVTDFFNLVLVMNPGVSFGIFSDGDWWVRWVLVFFACILSGVLFIWMVRTQDVFTAVGLALIVSGAVGNLIDRLRFGAVVDFLDLHYMTWHWPAFNVADSSITVGVGLLILDSFKTKAEIPEDKR
ncbi:MAG: signal peptidase II [Rhodospirillaceae bacterium]